MQLTQVVPRLTPFDGVGDYATRLAETLQRRHGVASRFIEAGGEPGRLALERHLRGNAPLLLHYVGYGYAPRGAPVWLANAIARTRASPLAVVFHELYATGRPWQSSFWLSGLQKHVVKRLARRCDGALLTRQASRQWLQEGGALEGKRVAVLPISSNVGEPEDVPPPQARPATLVVWGSAHARAAVYSGHWPAISAACANLGVAGIVDVGPPVPLPRNGALPIEAKGRLDAASLSQQLLGARFGLVVYPAAFLAKSTIFGAYAAHGLVPLVLDEAGTQDMDGVVAGENYLRLAASGLQVARGKEPADIARQARAWYAAHGTAVHADAVMHMLGART